MLSADCCACGVIFHWIQLIIKPIEDFSSIAPAASAACWNLQVQQAASFQLAPSESSTKRARVPLTRLGGSWDGGVSTARHGESAGTGRF